MAFKLNPSAVLQVSRETPLIECLRAMKAHGFGAVLVTELGTPDPVGIFTERDLLRWVDELQAGHHWQKPVGLLMSRPVITLGLDEIDRAAEVMLEQGIRHLPVVHEDVDSGERILTMISIRDVLRNTLRTPLDATAAAPAPIHVAMIASSPGMRALIRKVCAQHGNATIESLNIGMSVDWTSLDFVLFDIDPFTTAEWVAKVKELNAAPRPPQVMLFYDPSRHSEVELEALTRLGLSGRFAAYMKPLHLFVLLNQLRTPKPLDKKSQIKA